MKHALFCTVFLASTLAGSTIAAHEQPLFKSDTVLKAVLTAPVTQTYAQRHQDLRLYHPGQWTYIDNDGETQRLAVSIRTRGKFRREYCEFPPLQLNFKKKQVEETLFAGQDKLKVVAPCQDEAKYQQYVVLEYLAYRTFEILTDYSFRTRMLRLSYVDSDEKLESRTDIVFVIEDDGDMADRLGLERLRLPSVSYAELDQPKTALVQLFQLLIANSDYSVLKVNRDEDCCHNIQILGLQDPESERIPIPFDFDMSGIVNAEYAAPPSQVPIKNVRQRYYHGLCQPREILDEAIEHVQSKREEIIALYQNSAELDPKIKKKSLDYIEDFFAILDSPKRTEREIVGRCRGKNLVKRMLESSKAPT